MAAVDTFLANQNAEDKWEAQVEATKAVPVRKPPSFRALASAVIAFKNLGGAVDYDAPTPFSENVRNRQSKSYQGFALKALLEDVGSSDGGVVEELVQNEADRGTAKTRRESMF